MNYLRLELAVIVCSKISTTALICSVRSSEWFGFMYSCLEMNEPLDGTGDRILAGFIVSLSAAVVVKANNEITCDNRIKKNV